MAIEITLDGEKVEYASVLDAIEDCQVFSIQKTEDGNFIIVEECDGWFSITISKEQLLLLADEIKKLANA